MANKIKLSDYKKQILSRRPPDGCEGQRLENWKQRQVSQLATVLIKEAAKPVLPTDVRDAKLITKGVYLTAGDKIDFARQAAQMLGF